VGTNDAAESANDATTDPAKCSVSTTMDCNYATGSMCSSATSSTFNNWKSSFPGVQSESSPEIPQEAKRWIKHMEKIFRMAECTEEEKVIFATN
jgi:hypothetical protein